MSLDAMKWALDQPTVTGNTKLVLVIMADYCNFERGGYDVWPSSAELAQRSGLSDKTIERCLAELRGRELILGIGAQGGKTRRVPVYRLNVKQDDKYRQIDGVTPFERAIESVAELVQADRNRPPDGPANTVNLTELEAPVAPDKHRQFVQETPSICPETPSICPSNTVKLTDGIRKGTRKEQGREQGRERASAQPSPTRPLKINRPADIAEQVWGDWLSLRKAKKAPVTETVLRQAQREADKAGLTLERFMEVWVLRGSQGLMADWLGPHERGPAAGVTRNGNHFPSRQEQIELGNCEVVDRIVDRIRNRS